MEVQRGGLQADRGEKAIVLLNRRGFARMALCRACGWIARCPRCDVSLVVHRPPEHLACHHCGHEALVPVVCPSCRAAEVLRQGSGTDGLVLRHSDPPDVGRGRT